MYSGVQILISHETVSIRHVLKILTNAMEIKTMHRISKGVNEKLFLVMRYLLFLFSSIYMSIIINIVKIKLDNTLKIVIGIAVFSQRDT